MLRQSLHCSILLFQSLLCFPHSLTQQCSKLVAIFNRLFTIQNDYAQHKKITMQFVSNTAVAIESPNKSDVEILWGAFRYPQSYTVVTLFWDSVKKFQQHIQNESRENARFFACILDYVGGPAKLFSGLYARSNNLMQQIAVTYLSNVGPIYDTNISLEYKNTSSADVSNISTFTPPAPYSSLLTFFSISVDKASTTTLRFSWRKDSISYDWVDYFGDVLQRSVAKIVNQANEPNLSMSISDLISDVSPRK